MGVHCCFIAGWMLQFNMDDQPDHDDSLEVGLAAGLDVPTALVLSEAKPTKTANRRAERAILLLIWIALLVWWLLGLF